MRKITFLVMAAATLSLCVPVSANAQEVSYYSSDFKAKKFSDIGFTVLDANKDGTTWTSRETPIGFGKIDEFETTNVREKIDKTPAEIGDKDNDDWLFTPDLQFEAGKTYNMTIYIGHNNYAAVNGCLEIKLGDDKTAAAMTQTLLTLEESNMPMWSGGGLWSRTMTISVPETGDYFIGFHAVGKPGQKIYLADLRISAGVGLSTPAAVENLTLTPSATGEKKVTISFKAPTLTKDGSALTELKKIELRRGEDLIKTFENPTPGEELSFVDVVAASAEYTYYLQAFTEDGGGDIASAKAFVGVNVPDVASNVISANTGNMTAHITWDAPTVDRNGYPLPSGVVKYNVYCHQLYSSERIEVATGISDTFVDYTLVPAVNEEEEENNDPVQNFYVFEVEAKTITGAANAVSSNPVPMGDPYSAPYFESFVNGRASSIFTSTPTKGNNYWTVTKDFEDVSAADGDNGMIFLSGGIGGGAAYQSGLIDLGDMESPTIGFYTYNITGCDPEDHTLQLSILATDGTVKNYEKFVPAMGWNKTILSLDEFKGKVIRLIFTGERMNNTELHIDAIAVDNIFNTDLKISGIHVPAVVRSDEPFDVIVDVLNCGLEVSTPYTVELYCDNNKVDTYTGDKLVAGAYDHVKFERVHGILDPDQVTYNAKLIYSIDQDMDNNESDACVAVVRKNSYPKVTDLKGAIEDGKVKLEWSEPDTDKAQPYETFDNFESYQSWANANVGDWVFVDKDNATIAGFNDGESAIEMPGIPSYSKQSWWVFDNSHENFNNGSFATLSGHKFLASMVSGIKGQGFVQNDDWAISPELYGGPQTISINARSYSLVEGDEETFEVLYSDGSVEPDDFVSVGVKENIPSEYNAYEFDLPDGAKRFAIRNISNAKMMLMVDDVTYIPVGDPAAFSINGYNVYRDGVKINDAPIEECAFEDGDCGNGDHKYNVTVLYSAGESLFGNDFNPTVEGIYAIGTDKGVVEYYDLRGMRVERPLPGNIYIKRCNGVSTKVIIRK